VKNTGSVQVQGALKHFVTYYFLRWGVVTPKLENNPLSAVCDCLFNIFADTLHIWSPFPPSATWGRAMSRWQGTHLTWKLRYTYSIIKCTNWILSTYSICLPWRSHSDSFQFHHCWSWVLSISVSSLLKLCTLNFFVVHLPFCWLYKRKF
jgi:hypothetical protein